MSVQEIERTIAQLPLWAVAELSQWFEQFQAQAGELNQANPQRARQFGSARGLIEMAPDFDEPLEDFQE